MEGPLYSETSMHNSETGSVLDILITSIYHLEYIDFMGKYIQSQFLRVKSVCWEKSITSPLNGGFTVQIYSPTYVHAFHTQVYNIVPSIVFFLYLSVLIRNHKIVLKIVISTTQAKC